VSYTVAAVLGVLGAVVLDLAVLRTRLLRSRDFWTAYGIVLVFQLVVNGVLTGTGTVTYDPDAILGTRIANAPVEDLLFGFSLVLQTLAWWDFFGGRGRAQRSAAASSSARRGRGTATRRSSTQ
jgi:lycopene cyclase domain-containing protein